MLLDKVILNYLKMLNYLLKMLRTLLLCQLNFDYQLIKYLIICFNQTKQKSTGGSELIKNQQAVGANMCKYNLLC